MIEALLGGESMHAEYTRLSKGKEHWLGLIC